MATVPVDFPTLKQNHPYYNEILSKIDGDIKKSAVANKWETCAIQLSYALNRSGAPIPPESYAYSDNRPFGGKVRGLKGGDDKVYIYSVVDMTVYLEKRYGLPDKYQGSKDQMVSQMSGKQGIITFGYRHVDLWLGNKFHQDGMFTIDFWSAPSVKTNGVSLWPCGAPASDDDDDDWSDDI